MANLTDSSRAGAERGLVQAPSPAAGRLTRALLGVNWAHLPPAGQVGRWLQGPHGLPPRMGGEALKMAGDAFPSLLPPLESNARHLRSSSAALPKR